MREFFESLGRRAAIAGDQRAIITTECSLSYGELFDRVRSVAQWACRLPHRVGLLYGKSSDGIVSDLALSFAGKELIPLPAFFSDAQLSHIICTAQLSHAVSVIPAGRASQKARVNRMRARRGELRPELNRRPTQGELFSPQGRPASRRAYVCRGGR